MEPVAKKILERIENLAPTIKLPYKTSYYIWDNKPPIRSQDRTENQVTEGAQ
jgi:hypothetical protein